MSSRHATPVLLLVALLAAGPLLAQGTREAAGTFTRGRPLTEWVSQSTHYIPELRREALKAIAALGPGARSALPAVARATSDENEDVRFWAVEALRRIGPPAASAAPALLVVLSDDTRRVQQAARAALEAIGPAAQGPLVPALRAPDPWVRANAAEALGTIGVARGKTVQELARLLEDDSLWVRASAAWALGHLGSDARDAVKPLRNSLAEELRRDPTLRDTSARVRVENLVYALGRVGRKADGSAPLVMSVFHDGGDSLRAVAVEALASMSGKAVPLVADAVRAGAADARLEAARALRLMGPQGKKAVPALVKVLEQVDELDGGHDLVIAAADALGAMGKDAKKGLKVLERQRKRSVSPDVVAALERAIRKIRQGG